MEQPTILVIDDDATICRLLTGALEDEGYAVLCALGFAALRLAAARQPGCILLDGAQLSRLFRSHSTTAHIPIVALSALPREHAPVGLRYDVWIGKPFDLLRLFSVVESLIGQRTGILTARRCRCCDWECASSVPGRSTPSLGSHRGIVFAANAS